MKSSRNPTSPNPSAASTSATPAAVRPFPDVNRVASVGARAAPRGSRCRPSSACPSSPCGYAGRPRGCAGPTPRRVNARIAIGVPSRVTAETDRARDEDRDHRSASASRSSPATREPLNSTTSPGRACARTSASASAAVVVGRDVIGLHAFADRRDTRSAGQRPHGDEPIDPSRAARSPRRSCSSSAIGPSSAM